MLGEVIPLLFRPTVQCCVTKNMTLIFKKHKLIKALKVILSRDVTILKFLLFLFIYTLPKYTSVQRFGAIMIFSLEMNAFIQLGCIMLIKCDSD